MRRAIAVGVWFIAQLSLYGCERQAEEVPESQQLGSSKHSAVSTLIHPPSPTGGQSPYLIFAPGLATALRI